MFSPLLQLGAAAFDAVALSLPQGESSEAFELPMQGDDESTDLAVEAPVMTAQIIPFELPDEMPELADAEPAAPVVSAIGPEKQAIESVDAPAKIELPKQLEMEAIKQIVELAENARAKASTPELAAAQIGETSAEVKIGQGKDEIALKIATHERAVRVEANVASPEIAVELTSASHELKDALKKQGLDLVELATTTKEFRREPVSNVDRGSSSRRGETHEHQKQRETREEREEQARLLLSLRVMI